MVGNYGVPSPTKIDNYGLLQAFESDRIHATALLVQDYAYTYSHWDAEMSLSQWLKKEVTRLFESTSINIILKTADIRCREFLVSMASTRG